MIQNPISKSIVMISILFFGLSAIGCKTANKEQKETPEGEKNIVVGANKTEKYINLLKHKNVAVVANNTSVIFKNVPHDNNNQHLVDSLIKLGVNVTKVFAPEHGFRGLEDAGTVITDGIDAQTKIPVVSLYGKNRKPSPEHLEKIDLVIYDIQDVGVRFYTYISTLEYVMEACAELGIPVVVLDRPNPNGHYVDGPVVKKGFESFVGMQPIPIIYGMTVGEYAKMLNGEKWMTNGVQCDLTVIPLENYTHLSSYNLPLRPSPNLPNDASINLYASICMFEGTTVSCGRGTEMQFQIFGAPYLPDETYNFSFTPIPNFGSQNPKHLNQKCFGIDLSQTEKLSNLNFSWLIDAYKAAPDKDTFFREAKFNRLAGTDLLQKQIKQGLTFEEIKATWQKDLEAFKTIRANYLIY